MTIHNALTRFLHQGLTSGICPLCHVKRKIDREYMWHFFDEYSDNGAVLDELRHARGFCADHAEQLRAIEVDAIKSTLCISGVYLDTCEGLLEELSALKPDGRLPTRHPCLACQARDAEVARNAGYLVEELASNDRRRAQLADSPGLCVAHFDLAWERANRAQRELLLPIQHSALAGLVRDLREHIRKQGDKVHEEPTPGERDSWRRAIATTAGWPPGDALVE